MKPKAEQKFDTKDEEIRQQATIKKDEMADRRNLLDKMTTEIDKMNISDGFPSPEIYTGEEDFIDYLHRFNLIATANNWKPARCTQILPIFLAGEAQALYETLTIAEKDTWEQLTGNLANKLKKLNSKENARRILSRRKQLPGEGIFQFAQAIRNLVNRAFPDSSFVIVAVETAEQKDERVKRWRDDFSKDHFRNGVQLEIKNHLAFIPTATMNDAVVKACEIKSIQNSLRQEEEREEQKQRTEIALIEANALHHEIDEIRAELEQAELEQNDEYGYSYQLEENYDNWADEFDEQHYHPENYFNCQDFDEYQPEDEYETENLQEFYNSNMEPIFQFQNENEPGSSSGNPTVNKIYFPYLMIIAFFCLFGLASANIALPTKISIQHNKIYKIRAETSLKGHESLRDQAFWRAEVFGNKPISPGQNMTHELPESPWIEISHWERHFNQTEIIIHQESIEIHVATKICSGIVQLTMGSAASHFDVIEMFSLRGTKMEPEQTWNIFEENTQFAIVYLLHFL